MQSPTRDESQLVSTGVVVKPKDCGEEATLETVRQQSIVRFHCAAKQVAFF